MAASLNDLGRDAVQHIASFLLDQRHIANLRLTCKFWNDFYFDGDLWQALVARRFGPDYQPEDGSSAAETFRALASPAKPVSESKVVWLDGSYLEVVEAAGSRSACAVRLNSVCWLHLAATFPGVLPGTYLAQCRLKCLPNFYVDELTVTVSPGRSHSQPGCEQPSEALSSTCAWEQLAQLAQQANSRGDGWVLVAAPPLVVTCLGEVEVKVHATSGTWKRGLLFDELRLDPATG